MTTETISDIEDRVRDLLDSAIPPARIILIEEHPQYPGYLNFEPLDEAARGLFYQNYREWMSRHLILNEICMARTFTTILEQDGYYPIWTTSTGSVQDDIERWSQALHIDGYEFRPFQNFSLNRALERARQGRDASERFYFWNWSAGAGKASPTNEPVLTPSGWRTMGDLRPGDHVIGSDGHPTKIVAIHPQGVKPVYRVEFNDGTFSRCNADHLWNVRKYSTRTRRATPSSPSRKTRVEEAPWKTMNVRELMHTTEGSYTRRWQIPPLSGPVQFSDVGSLPIDPYMLGVLLGDGWASDKGQGVCTDRKIVENFGWTIRPSGDRGEYTVTAGIPQAVRDSLKEIGVWGVPSHEKYIPEQYLRADPASRLALLQGLLDTDGHAYKNKTGVEFSTTSPHLRDGIVDLIRGLQGRATISDGKTGSYTLPDGSRHFGKEFWRISAAFPEGFMPFRLLRKAQDYHPPVQRTTPHKIIVSIREEGVLEEQVCITVDAPDGLYVTRDYAVTHNSFCSGAAARALYDDDDIDLVIACTLSKLKENLRRTFVYPARLDAVVNDGTRVKRRRIYQEDHQVWVMNYEKLWVDEEEITLLTAGRRVLWILDEGHKLITDGRQNKARAALDRMTTMCEATVWPMSATVVGGNPLRFRDVFSLDGRPRHNPLGTKTDFIHRYAERIREIPIKSKNGRRFTFTTYDWDLDELQEVRHRVGDRTMAIRKTDPGVREQFKGIETLPVQVQATPATQELLGVITDRAREANRRGEGLAPYYLMARIACINPEALRYSSSPEAASIVEDRPSLLNAQYSAKIEILNDILEGIREAQDKAVVFCHWTELGLLPLARHLTVPHVLHYGTGQSAAESQAAQDRFKADPDITAFCSSDAGTHGLNLQEARYVVNVDPTYSYDDLAQRNARIDRADSHLDGLTAYVLITENSVEERVWDVCQDRRLLAAAVQGTSEELSYQTGSRTSRDENSNLAWLLFGEDQD